MREILLKNFLIYLLIYIVPIAIYVVLSNIKKQNKFLTVVVSCLYVILSLSTMRYSLNIVPFFIVVLSIKQIKEITLDNFIFNMEYKDYYRYFNIKTFRLWEGIKFFLLTYGINVVVSNIAILIFNFFNTNVEPQEVVKMMQNIPFKMFLLYVPCTMFFAPVLEEFVFRWFLFEKVFNKRFSIITSAIITSFIFAAIHFNLMAFPTIMAMALINCYLIHKKGYWHAVFNHVLFNSITTIYILINRL